MSYPQEALTNVGTMDNFVTTLFNDSPQAPFTYFMDMSAESDPIQLLSQVLMIGAQIKFKKQIADLTEAEVNKLREYMLSLGWDADYNLIIKHKEVVDYKPDGVPYVKQLKLNNWQITFKAADSRLRPEVNGCGAPCV